jgi:hypothetical protein
MVFQHQQVRASIGHYPDFTLGMGRSPGFGSTATYSDALFRLAFAAAPAFGLNLARDRYSPVHSTKGTPSPLARLRLVVSTRFQVLFHSPSGVLFTFPSRYWCAIGRQGVFSLGRWSSQLPTGFPVSRGTQERPGRARDFDYRAVTVYGGSFQNHFVYRAPLSLPWWDVLQPRRDEPFGLGCSRFARRYSGNRVCFLFLRVLRCFSSPGVPPTALWVQAVVPALPAGGLPHSEIPGSKPAYGSPRLFGVCPVLHRLLAPRHPPCALSSFSSLHANACYP